jgi:outer membrane protein OmpA-like peptidoglycan-associated protein
MKRIFQLSLFLFVHVLCSQEKIYEIFNTSVNSKYAEFGVTYTNNNQVLFASSKKNEKDNAFIKDRRQNNRQLYLELYSGILTEKGDIIQTEKFTKEANNKFFESDITFSADLRTVYFTWNNFYNTQKRIDSAKWKTLRIFKATFDKNFNIINTSPVPFNSSEYSVRNPELSADGRKLYFISDMPNGFGETDIYEVDILSDGSYGVPKNLGPNVNTKKAEMFPFIDENNILYFSSSGHDGKGRLDIFKSEIKDGVFQKPLNLPKPINSKSDDFAFVINNDTNLGFFSSTRKEGKGDADIYAFKLKDKEILACSQIISGLCFNKNNGQVLDNVQITLFHDNEIIETQTIQKGTNYRFDLKCNETYKIIAQKDKFETNEFDIKYEKSNKDEIIKNMVLTPIIQCSQLFNIIVLDKATNKPLPGATVSIYKSNELIDSLSQNENAVFEYETECNTQYRIVASHKDYRNNATLIQTSNNPDEGFKKELYLTYSADFITVRNRKMIKTDNIYFDLNKSEITNDIAIELNKVVEILKKYPNIKIEIESHTDSRAPDNYNLNLSNDRAISIKEFIISKGIDLNRIEARGFGESKLLNKCANGVRCTDGEHLLNRRTEFIVIDN